MPKEDFTMLPVIRIGPLSVSRLICGSNPFVAKSHLSDSLNNELREYYTDERVFATLRRCEKLGINTFQSRGANPFCSLIERYRSIGGKMNWICTGAKNISAFEDELDALLPYKPSAVCIHGELADSLYLAGELDRIPALLDIYRKTGLPVGLCAHFPEVLAASEDKGWKPDFYMASMYNLSQPDRSHDKNPTGERFEDSDIPLMYNVIHRLSAPTIALKIFGAGRRCANAEMIQNVFNEAFSALKPIDAVLVGMFDKYEDQPGINAACTLRAIEAAGA